jgi:hypothetical protein
MIDMYIIASVNYMRQQLVATNKEGEKAKNAGKHAFFFVFTVYGIKYQKITIGYAGCPVYSFWY